MEGGSVAHTFGGCALGHIPELLELLKGLLCCLSKRIYEQA